MKTRSYLTTIALALAFGLLSLGAQVCNDMDWDSVTDEEDNCPENYNPQQDNEDGDEFGDPCDPETTQHGNSLSVCYRSNWEGFTGSGWEDIETTLTPQATQGRFSAKLRWPDMLGDLIENGPGQHDGEEIWFMTQNLTGESYFSTLVEGKATEINEDGVITKFEGTFRFLICEECWPSETPIEVWDSQGDGVWTAEAMPPEFCRLEEGTPPYFDDDIDDDDADDDTAADDDAADDDTDDDDDDAADDDATADGDDDDDSGCGC